jgi:hypothetical protein
MADVFGSDKKTYARENLVKVPAAQVQLGMFVAELDRPWLGTPFLLQGFEVRSKSQIHTLANHCQYVYVLKHGVPRQAPEVLTPRIDPPAKQNTGSLLPRARLGRQPYIKRTVVR